MDAYAPFHPKLQYKPSSPQNSLAMHTSFRFHSNQRRAGQKDELQLKDADIEERKFLLKRKRYVFEEDSALSTVIRIYCTLLKEAFEMDRSSEHIIENL